MDIAGKTAIVTGGGSGIGRSIALALASGGCNVGVADIERSAAERVAAEVEGAGVAAAVTRLGMAPEEVAARVVKGIRDETFYVVSHSHVIEFAQRRWEEIAAAFKARAPRRSGDEEYAVANVMARLTGGS